MKGPFQSIGTIASVHDAFVFAPTGDVLAGSGQRNHLDLFSLDKLRELLGYLTDSDQGVTEFILFYPKEILFFRVIDSRVLLLVADAKTNPSLLRVTVDITEHAWRDRGLNKLFQKGKWGSMRSGVLRRIFGKDQSFGES